MLTGFFHSAELPFFGGSFYDRQLPLSAVFCSERKALGFLPVLRSNSLLK
jgi:hypothetical protein